MTKTEVDKLAGRAVMDRLAGCKAAPATVKKDRVRLVRVLAPTAAEVALAALMPTPRPEVERCAVRPAVVALARKMKAARS
jgi:hypothetical protein